MGDGYDDGWSDGYNSGWDSGAESVSSQVNEILDSVKLGDLNFEAAYEQIRKVTRIYA